MKNFTLIKKENFASILASLLVGRKNSEVAAAMGVGPSTISNYLAGTAKPDFYKMVALAEALGVSIDQLVFDSEVEFQPGIKAAPVQVCQLYPGADPPVILGTTSIPQSFAFPSAATHFATVATSKMMVPTIQLGDLLFFYVVGIRSKGLCLFQSMEGPEAEAPRR